MLSFGGKTFSGTSSVGVDFSVDGASYTPVTTAALTTSDNRFSIPLTASQSRFGLVRLSLDPSLGQPIIDNVAIEATFVPEPGMGLLLVAGIGGLAVLNRIRA